MKLVDDTGRRSLGAAAVATAATASIPTQLAASTSLFIVGITGDWASLNWISDWGAELRDQFSWFIGAVIAILVAFLAAEIGGQVIREPGQTPTQREQNQKSWLVIAATVLFTATLTAVAFIVADTIISGRGWATLIFVVPLLGLTYLLAALIGTTVIPDLDRELEAAREAARTAAQRLSAARSGPELPVPVAVIVAVIVTAAVASAAAFIPSFVVAGRNALTLGNVAGIVVIAVIATVLLLTCRFFALASSDRFARMSASVAAVVVIVIPVALVTAVGVNVHAELVIVTLATEGAALLASGFLPVRGRATRIDISVNASAAAIAYIWLRHRVEVTESELAHLQTIADANRRKSKLSLQQRIRTRLATLTRT